MKNVSKLMVVAALMATMASCSKSGDKVDPSIPVSTTDLLNQYITLQINAGPGLRILYFNKNGNDVQATFDGVGARRAENITMVDNSFTFDVNGDGKKVYTFKLGKDKSGKIALSSYTYKNADLPYAAIVNIQINNISEAQDPKGKHFTSTGNSNYFLNFTDQNTWLVNDQRGNDTRYPSYYIVSPGAWKGTRNDGTDYMGISVPNWKGVNEPVVLVQSAAATSTVEIYKADN